MAIAAPKTFHILEQKVICLADLRTIDRVKEAYTIYGVYDIIAKLNVGRKAIDRMFELTA